MKHIGIVVPCFPVPSETFVVTEINALVRLGHQVTVFCFNQTISTCDSLAPAVEVVSMHTTPDISLKQLLQLPYSSLVRAWLASYQQKSSSCKSLLRFGARLGLAAAQRGCSHLHSHFLSASLAHAVVAGELFSLPVSCVGHGHDVYQSPTDLPVKLRHCRFIVVVCDDMEKTLAQWGAKNIHLIHCGVNTAQFCFTLRTKNTVPRLLFIGRLVEKKGLKYALNAISKIPAAQRPVLDIVGEGPERDYLAQLATTLNIRGSVNFHGFQTPKWLRANLCSYDALIAPFCQARNGDRDTGPLVLKEAMATGLPVITTAFMGCKEIVSADCGWIVEPQQAEPLSSAILQLIQLSPDAYSAMQQVARSRIQTLFDASTQAQKLSALISQGGDNVCI